MTAGTVPQVRCPDCSAPAVDEIGRLPPVRSFAGRLLAAPVPGGSLLKCRQCALKFRQARFDATVGDALYDNGLESAWTTSLRTDQRLVRDHLVTAVGDGSVLDFGCYTGQWLGQLPDRYERFGVEINGNAAEVARRATGATVWPSLSAIDDGRRFDAVVCMDVVEHFTSPLALMGDLLERLRPGGALMITTGDADAALWRRFGARWWYCSYGEHVAFISRRWLRHHLQYLPAELVRCETFNYKDEGILKRMVRWAALVAALAGSSAISMLPAGKGRDPTALPGVGLSRDHLFIVLRKPSDRRGSYTWS